MVSIHMQARWGKCKKIDRRIAMNGSSSSSSIVYYPGLHTNLMADAGNYILMTVYMTLCSRLQWIVPS